MSAVGLDGFECGRLEEWSASMEYESPRTWLSISGLPEVSVASPRVNSSVERDGVVSPCWHANQLWGTNGVGKDCAASAELVGAIERVVCDHEGVCSESDLDFATVGVRLGEGLDIVQVPVFVAERDSHVFNTLGNARESVEKPGVVVGEYRVVSHAVTILGSVGAVVVLVIGPVHGGSRKVKSVNSLVEALGSPAQQDVIVVARSIRGCG
ncbi:hypothetical protein V6N12_010412 [Hibiscus sabdariffa]|uniref:Uncharacterized protein n=1 Tax=Hibiscus sabdariffa TaxID=183260 RepID=A0ABR2EK03_9ROSI